MLPSRAKALPRRARSWGGEPGTWRRRAVLGERSGPQAPVALWYVLWGLGWGPKGPKSVVEAVCVLRGSVWLLANCIEPYRLDGLGLRPKISGLSFGPQSIWRLARGWGSYFKFKVIFFFLEPYPLSPAFGHSVHWGPRPTGPLGPTSPAWPLARSLRPSWYGSINPIHTRPNPRLQAPQAPIVGSTAHSTGLPSTTQSTPPRGA